MNRRALFRSHGLVVRAGGVAILLLAALLLAGSAQSTGRSPSRLGGSPASLSSAYPLLDLLSTSTRLDGSVDVQSGDWGCNSNSGPTYRTDLDSVALSQGTWTVVTSPTTQNLHAVALSGSNDGWAMGGIMARASSCG